MSAPWWQTPEPDVPDREPDVHPATCLLCGFEATNREIWIKPAWWLDGTITGIPRCLRIEDCHARVLALNEPWPLLPIPSRLLSAPTPMQPVATPPPDEETPDDDWI